MSLAARLYRGEVSYDFMRRRKRWYAISGFIIVVSIASMLIRGFQFGIEFKGGQQFDFAANGHTVTQAHDVVANAGVKVEVAQSLGSNKIRLQTADLTEAKTEQVQKLLISELQLTGKDPVNTQTFSSSWGGSVSTKALEGLLVFLGAVIVYISFRYEPKMAAAAIVALIHDLVITAGVYSLVGFEVTPATVIALLTILGFSLYDTVVVFDKVRENTAGLAAVGKKTYTEAANEAVNQTLMRSINTSIIALLPVASLLFIGAGLLGAGTLEDLALAQLVGLAAGTYSSIFIATPLLVEFKERESGMKALAARVARSRAAETAREARSSQPARATAAALAGGSSSASGPAVLLDKSEPQQPERDAEQQAPGRRVAGMRDGVTAGTQQRRPSKRGKPGRPSGKKRR